MAASRSIRFKISVLLVIPLTSLVALWGFSTVITTSESLGLLNVATVYSEVGAPGDRLAIAMQREHVASAEYLGTRSADDKAGLAQQRQLTDEARAEFREKALAEGAQAALTPAMKARLNEVAAEEERLDETRAAVDVGKLSLIALARDFGRFPDAMQRLISSMTLVTQLDFYHQSTRLIMMGYAKDLLTRERALASGALVANRPLNAGELREIGRYAATREFLFAQGLAELDTDLRGPFDELARSGALAQFLQMEERLLSGDADELLSHGVWRALTDRIETNWQDSLTQAGAVLAARGEPMAIATFVRAGVAGLLGLIAVLASLVISYRVGRGLTRELAGLRRSATELAQVRLPRLVARLRQGDQVDVAAEAGSIDRVGTTTEVHGVAQAFDSVQRTAVEAAVEQARLREGVSEAFRNLARRSQSLLQRQLKLLDGMQQQTEDPEALGQLFRLDHLTTRMRRHAEGLVILSGGTAGRRWRAPVPVEDVLRGAAAQVEDYARVRIHPVPSGAIQGGAVADLMHLLAEIIENATTFSSPDSEVSIRGGPVAKGFAVEVEDRGLGLGEAEREAINERLASPPEFDPAETDRLGFAVVGLLAARHGIRVVLRPSPYGGTTAIMLIPDTLLARPEPSPTPLAPVATSGAGLPRRVRQGNLPPQLQVPVSPEEAHAVMSSPQAGWRRGRIDGARDGGSEQ